MRILALFIILTFSIVGLSAQSAPEGLWEGTITVGGIHSRQGYKFQMYLEATGKRLKGRTYIYLDNEQVIAMDVVGRIYSDRSIDLQDIRLVDTSGRDLPAAFSRSYQMVYRRGLYDNAIEGFWQEMRPDTEDGKRERGRIVLKKSTASKA